MIQLYRCMRELELFKLISHLFRNFFNIKGRASRLEYWIFVFIFPSTLYLTIVIIISMLVLVLNVEQIVFVFIFISMIAFVIFLIGNFFISIRRLHDFNRSGWWFLILHFVPIFNLIMVLALLFIKGKVEPNDYGEARRYSMSILNYLLLLLITFCFFMLLPNFFLSILLPDYKLIL